MSNEVSSLSKRSIGTYNKIILVLSQLEPGRGSHEPLENDVAAYYAIAGYSIDKTQAELDWLVSAGLIVIEHSFDRPETKNNHARRNWTVRIL